MKKSYVRMMDELTLNPKPYLLMSATCDETLSWMIVILSTVI
jgi:hypothetical protein